MRTLLTGSNIAKSYGRQVVLDGLNLTVADRDRIGLIGRNGAGKTTLLKIMAGLETADSGSIYVLPGTRLGVLNQNDVLPDDVSTVDYLSTISDRPEWDCRKLAARFGLKERELSLSPTKLSGGYQMRVKLVRMLLTDPNLLLLDEPVNYLDLPTLLLLERFLRSFSGALIVTSHDRELLQNLCTTTWEVERGRLVEYAGNVESYLDWKDEQAEYVRRTNKKLRREIGANQAFVDRFRFKASQASRAQSKLKHIAKLRTKLKSLDAELATVAFVVPCPPVVPGMALDCLELQVGYGTATIADGITFELQRGVKAAIVGENGRGKSTLLKTLAGRIPALGGSYKWWHKADIGYFAQQSEEELNPQETVLAALTRAAPDSLAGERILATAGAFLFHGDDLEKSCGVLSGGERSRLRLARLVLQQHNVLILDEPTNHLDAETVEVLARALKEYAGTVIVVSHARTFMNALVDRLYEIRGGKVRAYPGSYEEYVAELVAAAADDDVTLINDPVDVGSAATRRLQKSEDRDRRRKLQKIEERLKKLENEKGELQRFFFENPTEYDQEKYRRFAALEDEIARVEAEWLKLAEE